VIRYDNESGKGDHRHYNDREEAYRFIDVENLVRDFLTDVATAGGQPHEKESEDRSWRSGPVSQAIC